MQDAPGTVHPSKSEAMKRAWARRKAEANGEISPLEAQDVDASSEDTGVSRLLDGLLKQHRILEHDGLVNPLDDEAFCQLAEYTEKGDASFRFNLKRVNVETYAKLDPKDTKSITDTFEVRVRLVQSQENDIDLLIKLRRKYGSKYPKTFEALTENLRIK